MLAAMRPNPQQQAVSSVYSLPAPIGGLNARDALAAMKPSDAVILDNFFPEVNYVALRKGHTSYSTGMTTAVQTLMSYYALNGSDKLFSAANGAIWNSSVAGAATSVYSTAITVNKWQWINFTNTAGAYLLAVNGTDAPLKYDGTNWSTNSFSGSVSSSASIINIFQHKERVWLIEKNTLNIHYLASQAITGAAVKLPLGGVFNKGGQVVAGGALSINDAGDGMDDLLVAITDNGEAAVYGGTTPGIDFFLVGVYEIGQPVGARCLLKVGGDLIVITTKGALSMTAMLHNDRSQADRVAVTAKIQEFFNRDVRDYGTNFGWQGFVYPKARYAIVNVPVAAGSSQRQYVQNVITGAWCRFIGMNANCWGILNDELYFGGNAGTVYKADTGGQDNGGIIQAEMKPAFNACGSPGQNKLFTALRPMLLVSGTTAIQAGVDVDFANAAPTGSLSASAGNTGIWGTGLWGTALWGGTGLLVRKWLTVGKIGTYVAPHLKVGANGISMQVNGFDILYQKARGTVF